MTGLSANEQTALDVLRRYGKPMALPDLRLRVPVSRRTMFTIMRRLLAQGAVKQVVDLADVRRSYYVIVAQEEPKEMQERYGSP